MKKILLIALLLIVGCSKEPVDESIFGIWVYNTENETGLLYFNEDSTMKEWHDTLGTWSINSDTITLFTINQDTVKINFEFLTSDKLIFYNSDNDTTFLTKPKTTDLPFKEAIIGEWTTKTNDWDYYGDCCIRNYLNIYRDGQIKADFLKPDNEKRDGISRKWSKEYFETYYSNKNSRYIINTDSSLSITFEGTTTHYIDKADKWGKWTETLSKTSKSKSINFKIKNVFNNILITEQGDFLLIISSSE